MTSSAVGVTKALAGGEGVADQLLELLDVGEAAAIVAGPEHGGADAHLEDAAGAGHERDLADLRLERRQQLLRHPRRPQQPAALRAVLDLDTRTRLHGHDPAYRGPRIDADVTALPRSAQGGEDLFGDDLDLRGLVAIGDEDQAVDARGHVGAQLLDALLHAAADGVLDRRLAPRRDVPLGRQPVAHRRLRLGARDPDEDRELVGAGERSGIAAGLAREAEDLLPRLRVGLRRVEVRQPAVALRRHALEHGVDVAADEDRWPRALHGFRTHDRLAQVELVDLEADAILRPEPREDLEVALEQSPPLLEGDADRVELARVPPGRHSEDEPPLADHVEGADRFGRHRGIAQRQHEHPGAELDPRRARDDRGQRADGVQDRVRELDAEDDVVLRPERLEAQRLRPLRVAVERVDVRRLGGADEVLDGEADVHGAGLLVVERYPRKRRSGSSARSIASSSAVGGSVTATWAASRSGNPVCSRTCSRVTPGCSASSRIRRVSGSKPKTPSVVTTRDTPPNGRPARRRESPPSSHAGLVTKSTRATNRRFSCAVRMMTSLHSEA